MDFITPLVLLVVAAGALVLSELLKPKPEFEQARPASVGDFEFPTATEKRKVSLIVGTVRLKGPNVVWWGDFRQRAMTEAVKTGLWSKQRIVTGYRYSFGIQLGLCRGQIDAVKRVWIGKDLAWSGTIQDGAINLNDPSFFGGDDVGYGGIVGTLRIHSGSETQAVNSYLSGIKTICPAYRGSCYAVWEGGYYGNSTTIAPISFEAQRFPNGLALTGGKHIVNTYDTNPAAWIYEILTNTEWGFGYPTHDIDDADLRTKGETLYDEGNGISFLIDSAIEARDLLREIERQIDGVVYLDRTTGKFKLNLTRGDYDIDTVPQITDDEVVEVLRWDPGSWEGVQSEVRVEFADRQQDYKETFAGAQNKAAIKIQGWVEPATYKYPGVKDADLANQIASRQIRSSSRPVGQAKLVVDRQFWNLNPGDVVAWTDSTLGHVKLPLRVLRVNLGTLRDGKVTLTCLEDVFEYGSGFNGPPQDTTWTAPTQDVDFVPADESAVFEAPWAIIRRDIDYPEVEDRLWAGARHQGDGAITFGIWQRNAVGAPSGSYTLSGESYAFLEVGKLKTAMNEEDANPTTTVDVEADESTLAELEAALTDNATTTDVGQHLVNLILIGDELVACRGWTDQTTYVQLDTVYRGMLDTVPADHAVAAKVYLLCAGGVTTDDTIAQTNNVDVKLRLKSRTDETTEGEAPTIQLQMANRSRRPYPPVEMEINAVRYPSAPSWDTMKTGGSTLDDRGYEVEFLRRDWTTYDEVAGITTDAGTLDSNFPSKHSTEYRAEAIDDPDGSPTSYHTTSWASAALSFIPRTKLLRAGAGVKSTTMRIDVETRHDADGTTRTAIQELAFTFGPGTSTLDDDKNWGNIPFGTISSTWTAPQTGTYTFNIGTSMPSGDIEARINGGSWTQVIAAGNLTGTLAGVTATDTIEVQHLSNTGTANDTFCESLAPSGTVNAYAVMVY